MLNCKPNNCSWARKHKNSHSCTHLYANNCFLCNSVWAWVVVIVTGCWKRTVSISASLCRICMFCLICLILFLGKWGPCVHFIDAVPLMHVSNRSADLLSRRFWCDIGKWPLSLFLDRLNFCMWGVQSGPLCSSSWMFSVLCTVSPSLLAKAWSKGVFPCGKEISKLMDEH